MFRYLLIVLLWCGMAWAVNAPVTYNANGVLGLTVRAVDTLQCTGAPPSVTINGGATIYTFSSMGGGLYQRYLPPGCYHFFETSTWKATAEIGALGKSDSMMTIITANGWVTSARILDGTIAFADLGVNSVGSAHIVNGDVYADDLRAGNVYWNHLHANIKGTSPDTAFNIDKMQDSLRALYGAWSAGDYSVDVLSDKVKALEGTSFSGAVVSLVVAGQYTGIRLVWSMNTAANYAAVKRYEIYAGAYPYLHAAGSLDSTSYANLNNVMSRIETITSPRAQAQAYSVPCSDTTYVVVVAVDYGGNYISSGWSSGVPGVIDVGSLSSLIGLPYVGTNTTIADIFRTALPILSRLDAKDRDNAGDLGSDHVFQKVRVTTDGSTPLSGGVTVDTIDVVGPPWTAGIFPFVREDGVTVAEITFNARALAVGDSGRIYLEIGGAGELHFAIPYSATLQRYQGSLSIAGLAADSCQTGYVRGYTFHSSDKVLLQECVVVLK